MKVAGKSYRSIWLNEDGWRVDIIDQTRLPHEFEIVTLETVEDAARAIEIMQVRGAPLIGATAAYGVCLALRQDASDEALEAADARLRRTRPTAIGPHDQIRLGDQHILSPRPDGAQAFRGLPHIGEC